MRWSKNVALIAMLVMCITGCDDEEALCDAAGLTEALGGASSGDVVRIGSCRIEGSFTVPAGVTLSGEGPSSVLVGTIDERVIRLEVGDGATALRDLAIESGGRAGVVALGGGGGEVVIEGVTVTATRGVALAVGDVADLTMRDVVLDGPITPSLAMDVSMLEVTADETATHGLVIAMVGHAELEAVTVSEFAQFGAMIVDSAVTWTGGEVAGNLELGLGVWGGTAMLDSVRVNETLIGLRAQSFGAVFSDGAVIDTVNLEIAGSRDIGALHDGVEAHHQNVVALDNHRGGLWSQHSPDFEVYGTETAFAGNGFAGILIQEAEAMSVRDGTFSYSELIPRMDGERAAIECGDGIQLVEPLGTAELADLLMEDNARVGLLVETGIIGDTGLEIDNVVVSGIDEQLGAIAQGTDVSEEWDLGITREGVTEVNDEGWTGRLDTAFEMVFDHEPEEVGIIGDTGNEIIAGIIGDTG